MANPESKKLAVDVIARVEKLEKGMARARKAANDNYSQIERRTKTFSNRIESDMAGAASKVTGLCRTFAGGLAGGLLAGGVTGIVSQLGQVANSIATIGDEAKRAGLSARAFQEWKFVAEQNRIGIDQMVSGLKELSLRADEFVVTGAGPAAEAFGRLGYTAEELKTKLQDPSALLLEIIGRLGDLDRAAQIRISDEIFGGSAGERLVELLDQGQAGIRKTIDRAHELGIVLDDEVIRRAAEIDRRFNEIANTVGMNLKSAIVSAADSLADFIDQFRSFENQRNSSLQNRIREIGLEQVALENKVLELRQQQRDVWGPMAQSEQRVIEQYIRDAEAQRAALREEEASILEILNSRTPPAQRPTDRTWTPVTPPSTGGGSGSGSRDSSAAAAEREAEAVRRLIADLEYELQLVGATDLERATANALREAGASATEEQRAKIIALVAALHAEEEATRKASDAAMELRDIGRDVLGGFISDLTAGKSAADALADAISNIANRLLNSGLDALFGGGSGGGFLDGFFKSIKPRAMGGPVMAGQPYIVGEKRPELFVPNTSGTIVPRVPSLPSMRAQAPAAATPMQVDINVNVSGARGNKEVAEMVAVGVRQGLDQFSRQALPLRVRQIQQDPRAIG